MSMQPARFVWRPRQTQNNQAAAREPLVRNIDTRQQLADGPPSSRAADAATAAVCSHSVDAAATVASGTAPELAERLRQAFTTESYDCVICMNKIHKADKIWSCKECYGVLHIHCMKRWVRKLNNRENTADGGLSSSYDSVAAPRVAGMSASSRGGPTSIFLADHIAASLDRLQQRQRATSRSLAPSIAAELLWTCPLCQQAYESESLPVYTCWCGSVENPPKATAPNSLPHSCAEPCSRKEVPFRHLTVKSDDGVGRTGGAPTDDDGSSNSATCCHPCPLECHPGPCPPCSATGPPRSCHCGKVQSVFRCGQWKPYSCESLCGKELSCRNHKCSRECHSGQCDPCPKVVEIQCGCGMEIISLACGQDASTAVCKAVCNASLLCGHHKCRRKCHRGPCPPCLRLPSETFTCPCGRARLDSPQMLGQRQRVDCRDPIPICDDVCGKYLPCGHYCEATCHDSPCPSCKKEVTFSCRCGKESRRGPCGESRMAGSLQVLECDSVCGGLLSCRKHHCTARCCAAALKSKRVALPNPAAANELHRCLLPCDKILGCGKHNCELLCHTGKCPPCRVLSATPLECACGAEQIAPPVHCGTAPPYCMRICGKTRPACGHLCRSLCHLGECPPCTAYVNKHCSGGHGSMRGVNCSAAVVSCGAPCGRVLSNCAHVCPKPCHAPPCRPCQQQCMEKRSGCGHPCRAKCHGAAPCPNLEWCTEVVVKRCPCGRREVGEVCGSGSAAVSDGDNCVSEGLYVMCDNTCKRQLRERQLEDSIGPRSDLYRDDKEDWYEDDLVCFGQKNPNLVAAAESQMTFCVENRRLSVYCTAPSKHARNLLRNYAFFHYQLNCNFLSERSTDKWQMTFHFNQYTSRLPHPLLSEVMTRVPKMWTVPMQPRGFKKDFVLRFGEVNPGVKCLGVYSPASFQEIAEPLRSFVGSFRLRWEYCLKSKPGGVVTNLLCDCITSKDAEAIYAHISSKRNFRDLFSHCVLVDLPVAPPLDQTTFPSTSSSPAPALATAASERTL